MQYNKLRLSALGCQHLCGHLQQRFVTGIFIRFEVTVLEELNFISAFCNAGDGRVVFTNLSLIGKPPCLETCSVGGVTKLSTELGLIVDHPIQRQAE